eukprot:1180463-Prorocentrum_minimum.AAC.1
MEPRCGDLQATYTSGDRAQASEAPAQVSKPKVSKPSLVSEARGRVSEARAQASEPKFSRTPKSPNAPFTLKKENIWDGPNFALKEAVESLVPMPCFSDYKGDNGKIGVIGGCLARLEARLCILAKATKPVPPLVHLSYDCRPVAVPYPNFPNPMHRRPLKPSPSPRPRPRPCPCPCALQELRHVAHWAICYGTAAPHVIYRFYPNCLLPESASHRSYPLRAVIAASPNFQTLTLTLRPHPSRMHPRCSDPEPQKPSSLYLDPLSRYTRTIVTVLTFASSAWATCPPPPQIVRLGNLSPSPPQ